MGIKHVVKSRQQAEYEQALRAELAASSGNVRTTAHHLGVSREWVRRWVRKLGIDLEQYRQARVFKVLVGGRVIGSVVASTAENAAAKAVKEYRLSRVELATLVVVEDMEHGD